MVRCHFWIQQAAVKKINLTSVYRQPTFSGVFTNFESYIPDMHKRGLIEIWLYRFLDYALITGN